MKLRASQNKTEQNRTKQNKTAQHRTPSGASALRRAEWFFNDSTEHYTTEHDNT